MPKRAAMASRVAMGLAAPCLKMAGYDERKYTMRYYEIAAKKFASIAEKLGLSVQCAFVPFSQSRNAKEDQKSLNWRCAILQEGKPIMGLESIDYMQGAGHCPASKAGSKSFPIKPDLERAITLECESGKRASMSIAFGRPFSTQSPIPAPSLVDVLSSLCMDADAIDYPNFEQWAADLGIDTDSRKWEATYRQCVAYGLALRSVAGEGFLKQMQELAREM